MPVTVLKRYTVEESTNLFRKGARTGNGRPRLDMQPYLDIVGDLNVDSAAITVDITGDPVKSSKNHFQKAARQVHGKGLIFQRTRPEANELTFRLQNDDEYSRLQDRGQAMAAARKAGKTTPAAEPSEDVDALLNEIDIPAAKAKKAS